MWLATNPIPWSYVALWPLTFTIIQCKLQNAFPFLEIGLFNIIEMKSWTERISVFYFSILSWWAVSINPTLIFLHLQDSGPEGYVSNMLRVVADLWALHSNKNTFQTHFSYLSGCSSDSSGLPLLPLWLSKSGLQRQQIHEPSPCHPATEERKSYVRILEDKQIGYITTKSNVCLQHWLYFQMI